MRHYSSSLGVVVRRTILMGFALVTAGLFAIPKAAAQEDITPVADPETPFTEAYNQSYAYRGTAIRMSYQSPTYGLHNDQFSLGLQNRRLTGDGVLMLDGQYDLNLEHTQIMGLDIGLGKRWLYQGAIGGTARIFGATFWYDGVNSEIDNMFNQIGVSLESLGELWDFRVNTNIVVGSTRQEGSGVPTGEIGYYSYYLAELTNVPIDQAVSNVDFEIARRIGYGNIWAFGGGYHVWEEDTNDSAFGGKAGVRGYVYDDLLLQLEVTSDEMFDTKVAFNLIWYPGRSSRRHRERHTIDDRLMEPVIRNNYIALKRDNRNGGNALQYEDGEDIRVVHVASNATAPGDGSAENPYTSLDSINDAGSQDRDIILVRSDTTYDDELTVLHDNQRLLGEGGNVRHSVITKKYGTIQLPETPTGSLAGNIPTITNTIAGDVITLGTAATSREYNDDDAYSTNEVNNFSIDGGTRGIVSSSVGIGEATIKNMSIANTTGNAIELTPYVQTIEQANGTDEKEVLFNAEMDKLTFNDIEGNDIDIDATTSEPSTTSIDESLALTNITSTGGSGRGISITNNKSLATIEDYTYDGGTTGTGGIVFTNSQGGANISEIDITGGAGTGISIVKDSGTTGDSTGTFTITDTITEATDTTIADTVGAALYIDGGSANVTLTGLISQTATGSGAAFKVEGDHTGTVNLNEAKTDTSVIVASEGPGIQLGTGVGDGANGTYQLGEATLSNGAVVDVNGSEGTITFDSESSIENSTGTAFTIRNGEATVTYAGTIDSTSNGSPVKISDNTGGVAMFTGEITSTGDGIIIDGNSGGNFQFLGQVDLDTAANTAVDLGSTTGNTDATIAFSNLQINTTSGTGFNAQNGGTIQLTGTANTIDTTTGTGVNLDGVAIAASGAAFKSVSVGAGGTGPANGIVLNDVSGSGTFSVGSAGSSAGDGGTIQNTTGDGIVITGTTAAVSLNNMEITATTNSGDGVAITNSADVTLDNMMIDNTTGHGISLVHNNSAVFDVAITDSTIRDTTGAGIDLNAAGVGSMRTTINNNFLDTNDAQGINLAVDGTSTLANIEVNNNTVINSNNNEALLLTVTGSNAKIINFEANSNHFTNDSTTESTFDIDVQASTAVTLNTTIQTNFFTNADTTSGRAFSMASNDDATSIRLKLLNNTATKGSGNTSDEYLLENNAGSFSIENLSNVDTNNNGTIERIGTFTNDPGNIPTP